VDRLARLRSVPLFAKLSDESLGTLAAAATEFEAPAGQALTERGAPGSGLFVLEDGTVSVEAEEGVVELGPGKAFGELALLSAEGTRTARVRAKTDVRCLAIRREHFLAAVRADPEIAVQVIEAVASRYGRAFQG
jgi:CRP-like cAMP-binding protein